MPLNTQSDSDKFCSHVCDPENDNCPMKVSFVKDRAVQGASSSVHNARHCLGGFFICNISFYIRGVPSSLALKASLEGCKGVASALKTKEIQEEERKKKDIQPLILLLHTVYFSFNTLILWETAWFFPCFDWLDRRLPAVSGFICVSAYVLINTIFIPVALTRRRLGAPELLQSCKNCIRLEGGV